MAVGLPAERRTALSIVVICLVLVSTLAPVTADTVAAQQTQPDADNTVTRIEISEDGSARWTIQIRTRLDTDERVDEYEAFQSRFRNDTARYLDPFRSRMEGVVTNAENATGRQMQATNFTASTSIQEVPRRWGVVTYEFTWTNFAARTDGQVVVGDVFEGGFFIAANDSLQLVAGDGNEISRVDPAPDSREPTMVTWTGREDFADGRPRVVFVPPAEDNGSATGATAETTPEQEQAPLQGLWGPLLIGAVALLLTLAAVLYRRRTHTTADASTTTDTSAAPTTQAETADDNDPTNAVLTDEERVLSLIESNGGRMRQAEIADAFDWSASKTSRVIGRMADEGSVEKLQLGRENLVSVADDDDSA